MDDVSANRPCIAIVDDDGDMRMTLSELLHENGFNTIPLSSSRDYFELSSDTNVDLALIDLKLKGESGLTLAMKIRATGDLPIVMLTGVGDVVDKIVGLETGADDYLMKPFDPRELIARLRAVLRRYGKVESQPRPVADGSMIPFGRKNLDPDRKELFGDDGAEIPLTNAEYRLLEYFLRNPNRVIPRIELLTELGSDLTQYVDRTIDVLILRLRRKIENTPSKPVHLQTRRGMGYVFVTKGFDN